MKRKHFWRRRPLLRSFSTPENASNLRRFCDALSFISKVFAIKYQSIFVIPSCFIYFQHHQAAKIKDYEISVYDKD